MFFAHPVDDALYLGCWLDTFDKDLGDAAISRFDNFD
jgi:hypothetical protein